MTSDRGSSGGAELELTPVTPKSPGLNPNASVFNCKLSTSDHPDNSSWEHNDSGIVNNSADYSYANGDLSGDKSDIGVFSPASDPTFQTEFSPYTTTQGYSDGNANIAVLEDPMGGMVLDGQSATSGGGFMPETQSVYTGGLELGEAVPMTGIQYTTDTSGTDVDLIPTDGSPLTEDQLRQALKRQLETYFSRENLASDSYLQSQMDADQYVPITTVSNLAQIQRLTSDLQLIVELLRESNFVQVDEKGEKVRPNHNRCIVILREIPDTTPVQDVQNLFSGENCPKFVGCEFAHNSNWYVTFDSDADAQRAYQYLREEVGTFLGKPIMARIKAKPLLRTYRPQNGFMNKRFQQPVSVAAQPTSGADVVTSSVAQPQFTANRPFIVPNVSQYHLNGQQAMPFFPPPGPHHVLPTSWQQTRFEPSMMLALNGYQATNVKVNAGVNNRMSYQNVNRSNNNNRNQKIHHGGHTNQPSNRDNRISTNESLPPRLQHQHERHQQNSLNNNPHKPSSHRGGGGGIDAPISNHMSSYNNRRLDGPGPHPNHHGNHTHVGSHHGGGHGGSHLSHSAAHFHQQHHPHHVDHNANNHGGHSAGMAGGRMSQGPEPMQQRFSSRSYKSRRKRDDDGASRPSTRSSSTTQSTQRESSGGGSGGGSSTSHPRQGQSLEKFDYEPTSFPPLPGSQSNQSSGEVFESKLSDVVKGTAKPMVKADTPVSKPITPPAAVVSTATTTVPTTSPAPKPVPSSCAVGGRPDGRPDAREVNASSPSCQNGAGTGGSIPHVVAGREGSATAKMTAASTSVHPHAAASTGARQISKTQENSVPEKSTEKSVASLQSQSNTVEDKTSVSAASSVKLSYAQMVQRSKTAEASASALAEKSDSSDSDVAADGQNASTSSSRANHTLKEQGQQSAGGSASGKGAVVRGSGGKDFTRKDSRDAEHNEHRRGGDVDSKREEFRKENEGFRREEPREQRLNSNSRRMKENRERRFDRDRDSRRMDRRDRDGPSREKDGGARMTAVAK